jgi:signal peptidase II
VSAPAKGWLRAVLVLAAVLIADQVSKALVRAHLAIGDENAVFPGLTLVHVRNRGVAFSALEGRTGIVTAVIALAVLALVAWFARHAARPLVWLPVGLLAGGAAGNILDRARHGAVTDFLKLPAWPAFNVADISITFGVVVLLYVTERPRNAAPSDA